MAKNPQEIETNNPHNPAPNRAGVASVDAEGAAKARADSADQRDAYNKKAKDRAAKRAEEATETAREENRLPANAAVTNPGPNNEIRSNGTFTEKDVLDVDPSHPSVENNPRAGTSAVQNGIDWNDPTFRDPADPKFVGQGLDLSVYGKTAPQKK